LKNSEQTYLTLVLLISIFLGSCKSQPDLGTAPMPDDYQQEFQDWHNYRVDVLTAPTGWLRLVDLQWLQSGENRFGSGPGSDIRFPEGSITENTGIFDYSEGSVVMNVADGVSIYHEGESVNRFQLYDGENQPEVTHNNLIWYVDVRDDQVGIRIYSSETPKADSFDGFPRYPIQEEWYKKALFLQYDEPKIMEVDDVIGRKNEVISPGQLQFSVNGELYTLDAIESSGRLFIMFSDLTNRDETYQAGRYMLVPYPEEGKETTILDFNKAYNPPCAFSKFTTCMLPPPQNRLDLEIPAGEKRPVQFEGI